MSNNFKEKADYIYKNGIEVPITKDIYGFTALDVILGVKLNEGRQTPGFFLKAPKDYGDLAKKENQNLHMPVSYANEIFNNIKDYSFMHCGQDIPAAVV